MNRVFLLIFILAFACSCKTLQQTTTIKPSIEESTYKTYTSKLSGSYDGMPFRGQLRMQKDSVIWVSLTGFGFEVARFLMTQDSVFVLNKLQKEAIVGDYSIFERHFGLPVSFELAQQLLTDTLAYNTDSYKAKPNSVKFSVAPKGVVYINSFGFPTQITVKAPLNGKNEQITIEFSNQKINETIETPFAIPQDYDIIK